MKTSRNCYIDTLKGIAIICVVLGHCIQFGSGVVSLTEGKYFEDSLYRFIYSFHMPLFMIISGYLFEFTLNNHTEKDVIVKKIKSLLVPIVCWTTAITLIDLLIVLITDADLSIHSAMKRYIKNILFELWFLWTALLGSILTIVLKKIYERSKVLLWGVIPAVALAIFVLPDNWNLHLYKYTIPFFMLGYLWNITRFYKKIRVKFRNKEMKPNYIGGGEEYSFWRLALLCC